MSHTHYFPEEILIEILNCLPVKSLCRFTVVSRSWCALITSPTFISGHNERNRPNPANQSILLRRYITNDREHYTLIQDTSEQIFSSRLPTLEINFSLRSEEGYFRIVGSSNGLLCLVPNLFDAVDKVILWNPSIQRSFNLPRPVIRPPWSHITVFGSGVDFTSGDCKVVRIVLAKINQYSGYARLQDLQPPEAEVYSLKLNTWKRLVEPNIRCRIMQFSWSPVMLNGCPHWLAYRRRENGLKNLILTFDMSDELFREIMVPDALGRGNRVKLCSNLTGERLTITKYIIGTNVMSCNIWVMKEYGVFESWTSTYNFDLIGGMERVIGFREEECEVLATKAGNQLVLYDIKSAIVKELGIFGFAPSFYVNRYMESLVLLKDGLVGG